MSKSLRPSTVTERISGNGATQAGLSAIAALSGGSLASLLPVLATTLASARQKKRVEDALTAIDQQLRAHESDLRNINDNQYKLINETILALFHTTCDDKIEVLRNVVNNSMRQEELTSHDAVQLSRLVRDLSSQEVVFLLETFKYEAIHLLVSPATADQFIGMEGFANILHLQINSREGLLATSLASLGILAQAGGRVIDSELLKYMPITAKLIALLKTPSM
jgi:hypothetical protein